MRDLVNKPMERYNEIYTTIQHEGKHAVAAAATTTSDMQNELKEFLQHLHTNEPQIESHSLGSSGSGSAFSSYS